MLVVAGAETEEAAELVVSGLPSFSDCTKHRGEDRLSLQHVGEPLDQRQPAVLRHVWDELGGHDPLPEQRVGASLGGVGLEMTVVAERLPGGPKKGQQGDGEGIDQPQAVASVGAADVHLAQAHAVADILAGAELACDAPALRVQVAQLTGGPVGGVGDQAPGLLHALGVDAHHGADRIGEAGDGGAVQHASTAAQANPVGGLAALAAGGVTMMLARMRITKLNFSSSRSTRSSLWSHKPRSATTLTATPSGSAAAKRTST